VNQGSGCAARTPCATAQATTAAEETRLARPTRLFEHEVPHAMIKTFAILLAAAATCWPQGDPAKVAKARTLLQELSSKLAQTKVAPDLQADVAVYLKAADWTLRHPEEFFRPASNDQLIAVLEKGLARVAELQKGAPSWPKQKGRLSRGFISRVDGGVQPYGMVIPEGYDATKPSRLDVVLHGRADTQN